jgi:uncharacterized membrane protein YagU involved in acid resistance
MRLRKVLGGAQFTVGSNYGGQRVNELAREVSMSEGVHVLSAALSTYVRPALAVVVGGFIVGVLDLTYAIVVYSPKQPILVPQTIASGLLGARSYEGGATTAVLGVVLHFLIAFAAAAAYYLASRNFTFLVHRAFVFGLMYGAFVYLFMHWLVLPLSAISPRDMPLIYKASEFVEHWFCVGLPIALSVRHYSG